MVPWILGAVALGLGAYLLNDAKSSNATARRAYDDACDDAVATFGSGARRRPPRTQEATNTRSNSSNNKKQQQ